MVTPRGLQQAALCTVKPALSVKLSPSCNKFSHPMDTERSQRHGLSLTPSHLEVNPSNSCFVLQVLNPNKQNQVKIISNLANFEFSGQINTFMRDRSVISIGLQMIQEIGLSFFG